MLGYSVDEIVGKIAGDLSPDLDAPSANRQEVIDELKRTGETRPFRKHFTHRNGSLIPVEIQLYATFDENGQPDGVWGVFRDQTDLQYRIKSLNTLIRIANAVNETREMGDLLATIRNELNTIVDTTNFYIALYNKHTQRFTLPFIADTQDRIASIPAKRTLTGLVIKIQQPLMVTGEQILDMAKDDIIDIVGSVPEMWLGVPLKHQGKLLGVVAVQTYSKNKLFTTEDLNLLRFVSEQIAIAIQKRQAEDELRTSEDRLRTTIDGLNDVVHVIDHDMRMVLVNQACRDQARAHGLKGEPVGDKLLNVFPFLDADVLKIYERVFSTGQTIRTEGSHELNGRTMWSRVRRFPILDSYGNVQHVLTVMQDMTEHHEAEHALMQAQKMEAMGALAGGIAHDFNNILSVILGYSEMAQLESQKPNVKRAVKEITQASKRAKELVSQILAFSRQEEESMQAVNLGQITREVLRMLRASLPSTIQIKRKIKSESSVLSDPTRLHQVIMNLCTNAFHAMQPDGGVLTVEVEDLPQHATPQTLRFEGSPRYIRMRVTDTGKGIPPDVRERIFEPYFTTKAKGQGTGLGLAIINSIVTVLEGEIHVDSKVGEGTCFTVYLPITEKATEAQAGESAQDQETTHSRILFVDDEPTIVSLSRVALKRYGYEVQGFTSSSKAIEEFTKHPNAYDLVITDLTMPRPTGVEMVRIMRKIRPDLPVILCTGYSELIEKDLLKEENIEHVLYKPIPVSAYINVIESIRGDANHTAHISE